MAKRNDTREAAKQRLYRRGKTGRYYIDLRDLGGGREALIPPNSTYATDDETVALDLAGKQLAAIMAKQRGQHFEGLKRFATLGEFAREWIVYRRQFTGTKGYAGVRTINRYEDALAQLFKVVNEDVRIDRFSKSDAKAAIIQVLALPSKNGGTLQASSVKQVLAAMQLMYDHAQDEGVVPADYNPWRAVRKADRPKMPSASSTDFLEVYEGAALIEACDRLPSCRMPLRTIVAALLLTGARKEEVLGLEVSDIDFRRRTIRITANRWRPIKTHDERTVPLWPQLEEELKSYLARSPRPAGLMFPSEDSNERREVMITAINKQLARARDLAAKALGEPMKARLMNKRVTPRALRPTYCAARLQTVDNGAPVALWTVRGEMGHGSMKMIERVYGRLGDVRHRGAVVEYTAGHPVRTDHD